MADSADRATVWSTAFRSSFGQGQPLISDAVVRLALRSRDLLREVFLGSSLDEHGVRIRARSGWHRRSVCPIGARADLADWRTARRSAAVAKQEFDGAISEDGFSLLAGGAFQFEGRIEPGNPSRVRVRVRPRALRPPAPRPALWIRTAPGLHTEARAHLHGLAAGNLSTSWRDMTVRFQPLQEPNPGASIRVIRSGFRICCANIHTSADWTATRPASPPAS